MPPWVSGGKVTRVSAELVRVSEEAQVFKISEVTPPVSEEIRSVDAPEESGDSEGKKKNTSRFLRGENILAY